MSEQDREAVFYVQLGTQEVPIQNMRIPIICFRVSQKMCNGHILNLNIFDSLNLVNFCSRYHFHFRLKICGVGEFK